MRALPEVLLGRHWTRSKELSAWLAASTGVFAQVHRRGAGRYMPGMSSSKAPVRPNWRPICLVLGWTGACSLLRVSPGWKALFYILVAVFCTAR